MQSRIDEVGVTAVITLPPSLDDLTFEQVFDQLAVHPAKTKLTVDARRCTFATPFGLTALLALAETRTAKPIFLPPEAVDTLSYWARNGFFRYAEELYDVQGTVPRVRSAGDSDVLLEVTRVTDAKKRDAVIRQVRERALQIFTTKLKLEPHAITGLAAAVSAACQNIVEHAGCSGWVMIQAYNYRRKLSARFLVVVAVCDAGVGIRRSLERGQQRPMQGSWNDAEALEATVFGGTRRNGEPGRGQPLRGFCRYVHGHEGKLSVRSGTARIALVPAWDDDLPMRENLAPFPGVQLQMTIPARAAE